jgi:hypothetical protein
MRPKVPFKSSVPGAGVRDVKRLHAADRFACKKILKYAGSRHVQTNEIESAGVLCLAAFPLDYLTIKFHTWQRCPLP